ncbi:hypothetical protein ACOME3_010635 [Neoechinorhynchus agilis]
MDQRDYLKEVFAYLDRDRDGFIFPSDLGIALRSCRLCPSQLDIAELISKHKGKINWNLFSDIAENLLQNSKSNANEVREALRVFEKTGNGLVDMHEMRHAMTSRGEKIAGEEFKELIESLDMDADGNARFEDLVRILLK